MARKVCNVIFSSSDDGDNCGVGSASEQMKDAKSLLSDYVMAYLDFRREVFKYNFEQSVKNKIIQLGKAVKPEEFIPYDGYAENIPCRFGEEENGPPTIIVPTKSFNDQIDVTCAGVNLPDEGSIAAMMLYKKIDMFADRKFSPLEVLAKLIKDLKKACLTTEEPAGCGPPELTEAERKCVAAEYMRASLGKFNDYNLENGSEGSENRENGFERYMIIAVIGRDTESCGVVLRPWRMANQDGKIINIGLLNLLEDLSPNTEVFTYGVIPRNEAQRVSTFADSQEGSDVALSEKVEAAGNFSAALGWLKRKTSEARSVEALPFMVGFSRLRNESGRGSDEVADVNSGEFGWVIGPHLESDGKTKMQVDSDYPVSALVSIPAWWRSVRLLVKTCWFDRWEIKSNVEIEAVSYTHLTLPTKRIV